MSVGTKYNELFNENSLATKTISGIEVIKEELKMLINFPKYSLFFGNDIGLDLEKYLYLTNRMATFNLIRADIEAMFEKYGRARLSKIEMRFDNTSNAVIIDIEVITGAANSQRTFNLSMNLSD